MVDCRLCKNEYTIYESEIDKPKMHVCIAKGVIIDKDYITDGPCDLYVDVDGYVPRNGDM